MGRWHPYRHCRAVILHSCDEQWVKIDRGMVGQQHFSKELSLPGNKTARIHAAPQQLFGPCLIGRPSRL
jgi:hypothetical protein